MNFGHFDRHLRVILAQAFSTYSVAVCGDLREEDGQIWRELFENGQRRIRGVNLAPIPSCGTYAQFVVSNR